jgi:ABC-type antimicrobial peptide transport system permease subunit
VFAALLLCNFISVSISYKKKEIGILRAVGARGIDVFKIFFSESLIIAAICVLLASIGTALVCKVLNAEMGDAIAGVSLFVFRPLSLLMLIGIAILTAAIATFLPVWNAARKKPVESIRAL